jgi:hypothetical protein
MESPAVCVLNPSDSEIITIVKLIDDGDHVSSSRSGSSSRSKGKTVRFLAPIPEQSAVCLGLLDSFDDEKQTRPVRRSSRLESMRKKMVDEKHPRCMALKSSVDASRIDLTELDDHDDSSTGFVYADHPRDRITSSEEAELDNLMQEAMSDVVGWAGR